ncbi:Imm7 family immunity protein [Rhodopirellula baltica]|uniref:Uncharacterized protein n=1 Tax=Rhodopirellula baltica WH47 TaxID=991778 RepID=F2AM74_RHOBT|nr:Imm7 family immunity protein [Rhodopirellula baltica]EGF29226.1 hypothetical protein RBWH47_02634 [Rhodopirellula baltica WH47]
MIEFHGWASISYHTHDTDSFKQDACWDALVAYVADMPNDFAKLQRYNCCDSLTIAGQHNHVGGYVIDLFRWIAENCPGSYGLLYIRDDEDSNRGGDFTNVFRVWRLCRGTLTEMDDPFLSPVIPTVEDEWDETRDD